jgi:hypothetical protein
MDSSVPDYLPDLFARASSLVNASDYPYSIFNLSFSLQQRFRGQLKNLDKIHARLVAGERSESLERSLISTSVEIARLSELETHLNLALDRAVAQKPQVLSESHMTLSIFRALRSKFLEGEPFLVSPPFPPLCGKIPVPATEEIPRRVFACVYKDMLNLVLICHAVDLNSYEVCWEDPTTGDLVKSVLHRDVLLVFPWCLPECLTPETDFKPGNSVCALSTLDFRGHHGVIRQLPTERGAGYSVEFLGLARKEIVPELWITSPPRS